MVTKDKVEKVWGKAKKVRGKDSSMYRRDSYENMMYKPSRGKLSDMGWDVGHIKPKSNDGSDSTVNLQVLNSSVNRAKGADQRKKSGHSSSNK